jgi:hypothetical protein
MSLCVFLIREDTAATETDRGKKIVFVLFCGFLLYEMKMAGSHLFEIRWHQPGREKLEHNVGIIKTKWLMAGSFCVVACSKII